MAQRQYAIVRARFNDEITDGLLRGALKAFQEEGVGKGSIDVVEVPGSWEIPYACLRLASTKKHAGIVTIGAVIKHETSHDYWINHAIFPELQRVARKFMLPVTLGILTCETWEQAADRSRNNKENRGYLAVKAAVEMARLFQKEKDLGSSKVIRRSSPRR